MNEDLNINCLNENAFDSLVKKWQKSVDLLAEIMNVPAALIMRIQDENMEVFISSESDNP